jgi:hypothetical protein
MKMDTVPSTLDEIRDVLDRERRQDERRAGSTDQRIFPRQRRVGDRRDNAAAAPRSTLAGGNALPSVDDLIFEISDDDMEVVDQTMVRDNPMAHAKSESS